MSAEASDSKTPLERLEAATGILHRERQFFDALMQSGTTAEVMNLILVLTGCYRTAAKQLAPYVSRRAQAMFGSDPQLAASIMNQLLSEITRAARLTGYLCLKGLVSQAFTVARGAMEHIGVYTHLWVDPGKLNCVLDPDSPEYARTFRYTTDKSLKRNLEASETCYRFMHCKGARALTKMYALVSRYFVHGIEFPAEKAQELSCGFVDRASPAQLEPQYRLVQMILAVVFTEIVACIPEDHWLSEDVVAVAVTSAIFMPILGLPPGTKTPELDARIDSLFEALANVEWVDGD